jgi:hypothetical protein
MITKSKRTGGPRTQEGKAKSASNSLKSGAYSNITVLPGEIATEYQELEDQLHQDFQPADLIEASMVRGVASLFWKKLRLEKLEHAAYLQILSRPLSAEEIIREFRGPLPVGNYREYLVSAAAYDEIYLNRLVTEVDQVRKVIATDRTLITEDFLRSKYPLLAKMLNSCIVKSNEILISGTGKIETKGEPLYLWRVQVSVINSGNFLEWMLNAADDDIDGLNWVLSNQNSIEVSRCAAKDARLHKVLFADKGSRVFDDLNRALYKMLAELRKHQEWRRHRPIDITPERVD